MSDNARDILVIGGGLTGLGAAALLARDGHRVTVLDRDPQPPPDTAAAAWASWDRPGVAQFRQVHAMLPRWAHVMSRELPEVIEQLLALGGTRSNLLHLNPESVTAGWRPGARIRAAPPRSPSLHPDRITRQIPTVPTATP